MSRRNEGSLVEHSHGTVSENTGFDIRVDARGRERIGTAVLGLLSRLGGIGTLGYHVSGPSTVSESDIRSGVGPKPSARLKASKKLMGYHLLG